MAKILLSELAAALVERNGLNKKAATGFVNELFNVVQDGLGRERQVKVKGLGTFKIIEVEDRESVNVNTGERVLIEGHSKISFVPDSTMKELVNKPFSQFDTVVLNEGVDFEDMPKEAEKVVEEPIDEPIEEPVEEPVETPVPSYDDMDVSSVPLVEFVTDEPSDAFEAIEEPVMEEPVIEEPVMEEPVTEEPAMEEPVIEEPVIEEPVVEEPVIEEPVVEEPVIEEPVVEEPVVPLVDDVTPSEKEPLMEAESTEESAHHHHHHHHWTKRDEIMDDEEEYDDDDEESSVGKWIFFIVIILLCGLCFGGGYYVGKNAASSSEVQILDADSQAIGKEVIIPDSLGEAKDSTLTEAKTASQPEEKKEVQPEPKIEPKPEVKPEPKAEPKPALKAEPKPEVKADTKKEVKPVSAPEAKSASQQPVALDKYEKMDSRIRLGAYRIVGTDHVEKIRPTDNLARICKRTIGPDMECYLMAYNGIKSDADLKPGADIKIPKLELKKKKVKKVN